MTNRMKNFVENMVDDGFNRDDVLDALSDGEVLGRYFPAKDDDEDEALRLEVEEAYDEVSKWPERFVFRYLIGYRECENEEFVEVEASTQDEAVEKVLEDHQRAKLVWHECLGLASGTLEDVLNR